MPTLRDALARTRRQPLAAALWCGAIIVILGGYAAVHGRLNVHYLDDAWSTSFAYQFVRHGITEDVIFRPPGTLSLVFGKTQAYVYALFLQPTGWTRSHVHWVSTLLVFASAATWNRIGRAMGLLPEPATLLGLSLLLFQVSMQAANLARPDGLTLLLMSLSLLAFVRERMFLAGLLALIAFENHPIGLTVCFYGLGWAIHARASLFPDARTTWRRLAFLALGGLCGLAWFLFANRATLSLHNLGFLFGDVHQFGEEKRNEWTYLHYYFKHCAPFEWLFFLAALAVYLARRLWRNDASPLWILALVLASALLARRQNGLYALLAYPAFALVCVHALQRTIMLRLAFLALLLSFAWRTHQTWQERRSYHFEQTLDRVVATVPRDGLPVVGLCDFWFGFQERRFIPSAYQAPLSSLDLPAFYLVDSKIKPTGFQHLRPEIEAGWRGTTIARFPDSDKTEVTISRFERKEVPR